MNTFYSRNFQCWPPVPNRDMINPESNHWEAQAQQAQRRLAELLGPDDYRLWAEITWPGETIDGRSWQQIFDTCQFALDHKDAMYQTLECTCNPAGIGARCSVCQAHARTREREEYSND